VTGNPKRILLTGGAGFIGSHVAEALLRRGVSLALVDNLDDFYSPAWKKANLESIGKIGGFDFFDQDICATERMKEIFASVHPDAVIHLAARAGVRPSIEQPRLYERVNVAGTVNLLELCRDFRVSRLIFGSSSSVYGESGRTPFSEEQFDLRPISPYAATKLRGNRFATPTRIFINCRWRPCDSSPCMDRGSGLIWPSTNSWPASKRVNPFLFLETEKLDGITRTWMTSWRVFLARWTTIFH